MKKGPFRITGKVKTKDAKVYYKLAESIFNRPKNVKALEVHMFNAIFGCPSGIYIDENCNFKVVKL
jgi:hypothetical protein